MATINFQPEAELAPSDPSQLPCLFLGKLEHIKAAGYSRVSKFLGDKVDEKVSTSCCGTTEQLFELNLFVNCS